MLQMLLASAGAAIGAYFGGPVGASIGYSLGSMAGSMLYGTEGQKVEGPRLQDFTVQTSTYGLPIPIVYGTVRLPGNVIWTAGIRESRQTQTKNGVKTRTFCNGPPMVNPFLRFACRRGLASVRGRRPVKLDGAAT